MAETFLLSYMRADRETGRRRAVSRHNRSKGQRGGGRRDGFRGVVAERAKHYEQRGEIEAVSSMQI